MRRLISYMWHREAGDTLQWRGPRVRSLVRFSVIAGLTVITIASALNRDVIREMLITTTTDAGLKLDRIEVHGRSHTPKRLILASSELTLGQPMLEISLAKVYRQIIAIGWIKEVVVEREMPSTIRLILVERVPLALLQTIDGHRVIDDKGTIITGADPAAFSHLTVVSGKSAASQAATILNILKTEPELFAEVWAISLQSERRWDVHLRSGIRVRLPESDPQTAWSRLAIIDHSKNITARDLAVIDMRFPDQMIVEPNIPVRGKGSKT